MLPFSYYDQILILQRPICIVIAIHPKSIFSYCYRLLIVIRYNWFHKGQLLLPISILVAIHPKKSFSYCYHLFIVIRFNLPSTLWSNWVVPTFCSTIFTQRNKNFYKIDLLYALFYNGRTLVKENKNTYWIDPLKVAWPLTLKPSSLTHSPIKTIFSGSIEFRNIFFNSDELKIVYLENTNNKTQQGTLV